MLLERQHVGDRLARMMLGREHVDHRHGGVLGELRSDLVGPGPDPDRRDVAREHIGGVADRLATAELEVVGPQHHWVPSELDDPGLE